MNSEQRMKFKKAKELLQNTEYAGIALEMLDFIRRKKKDSEIISAMTETELADFIDHYGQTRVSGRNWQTDTNYSIPSHEMRNGIEYVLSPQMRIIYFEFEKYIVKLFSNDEDRLLFDLELFYFYQKHCDFPWEYDYDQENQYVKSLYLKRVDMILSKMLKSERSENETKRAFRLRISNQVLCKMELLQSFEEEKNKCMDRLQEAR